MEKVLSGVPVYLETLRNGVSLHRTGVGNPVLASRDAALSRIEATVAALRSFEAS